MMKQRLIAPLTLVCAVAFGAMPASAAKVPAPPANTVGVSTSIALPAGIAKAPFTTAAGKSVSLNSLSGVTILIPMLTLCPEVCPFTTGNILQLHARLQAKQATGVQIVALSVDPQRDTKARLAAYAKLLGVSPSSKQLQFWRGGSASTNKVMKFFGMRADRLAVQSPAPKDWWTGKPITYDVDHSDGFFVLDANHKVKFISGLAPRFVGTLSKALKGYLSEEGLDTLAHPGPGWTPSQALQAMAYVARRPW